VRVIVVGDKVLGAMLRQGKDDFRSNIGAGGCGSPFALDQNMTDLALEIARVLDLKYCGIDFLLGENGPIVCEVNSNAFFSSFEKVTGINVAKAYAQYILQNV
jgi:RimK family alpha-L-glutamate ligase